MASGHVCIKYGLKGPNFSITSACSSGSHAIGESMKSIRDGYCDVMITGGTESVIHPLAFAGFSSMKALSTRNQSPQLASRPFDRDRDGFVLSEACGILILEDYERASRRGAHIYGELSGYGVSSDGHHITNPCPQGLGASLSMKMALDEAGVLPDEVSYVNAHGTGTPTGDGLESLAIKNVFGEFSKKIWISSTKGATGHALGAAGAIESIF